MHRPASLAAVEAIFEELSEAIEERPEVVRARLRDLIPEYSAETGGPAPVSQQRTHAK
jgi:hypothetical protein